MFNAMRNCFFSQPSNRAPITLVVCLTLALVTPLTLQAQPKALARDRWPNTVEQAVPHIIQALKPAQRSIVQGTSKDNLMMLQGEWGEDIEVLLGLDKGNSPLAQAACGRPCTSDQAAFELMKAAWEALQRSAPRQ